MQQGRSVTCSRWCHFHADRTTVGRSSACDGGGSSSSRGSSQQRETVRLATAIASGPRSVDDLYRLLWGGGGYWLPMEVQLAALLFVKSPAISLVPVNESHYATSCKMNAAFEWVVDLLPAANVSRKTAISMLPEFAECPRGNAEVKVERRI